MGQGVIELGRVHRNRAQLSKSIGIIRFALQGLTVSEQGGLKLSRRTKHVTGIPMGLGKKRPGLHRVFVTGNRVIEFSLRFVNLGHAKVGPSQVRPFAQSLLIDGQGLIHLAFGPKRVREI